MAALGFYNFVIYFTLLCIFLASVCGQNSQFAHSTPETFGELRGLPEFDCTEEPGHSFLLTVQDHAAHGFPIDDTVKNLALWFYSVFQETYGKDWAAIGHAVINGEIKSEDDGRPSLHQACYFGAINALALIAQQLWKADNAHARSALRQAVNMLHYDRYDFIVSTPWPWTSFCLYKNLKVSENEAFLLPERPESRMEPRVLHTFAPSFTPPPPVPDDLNPLGSLRGEKVRIFAIDSHSSTTVELFYVLSHAVSDGLDIEYHTLDPRCGFVTDEHRKSWCDISARGDSRVKALFEVFSAKSDKEMEEFVSRIDETAAALHTIFHDRPRAPEVFVCTMLPIFCLLFETMHSPILGHLPGIITLQVPDDMKKVVLDRFIALQARDNVFLGFTHPFLAEQHAWQTGGHRLAVISVSGVDRDLPGTYPGLNSREVVVGHRPSWEFLNVIKRFEQQNLDIMTFRFRSAHVDLKYPSLNDLVKYKAFVYWSYGINSMLMNEVYASAVPMWVPADIWRWASHWGDFYPNFVTFEGVPDVAHGHPYPPVLHDHKMLDIDVALYWSSFNEAARLPHVGRFASIPDLILQLNTIGADELASMSERMAEWTKLRFHQQQYAWKNALGHALLRSRSMPSLR
eukprot:TRINITY_DN30246_c0_g1_i2.p1 TRINITY_DN30246_c0_g1~~TRINITY_DN30246_c0_g1_i2.p1  ORF type:complete len:629 (+),score=83.99 TRINITY_DN30246_c0_g1_i2:167-2053(+)